MRTDVQAMLLRARKEGYATGSFSARYLTNIGPILQAAEAQRSPVIVQVSQKELKRYGSDCAAFAAEFRRCMIQQEIQVPAALHLDHTKDLGVIGEAIEAGFDSVMIDASALPLQENADKVKAVVRMAHAKGVQVEAELGRISSHDLIETDASSQAYTDPEEAGWFVEETGVDFLAVSVGTVHGSYGSRTPHIEIERIREIRKFVQVPLVLHGASGVPASLVKAAITIAGGGVSKINIATDLEEAFLRALHLEMSITNADAEKIPEELLRTAHAAVAGVAADKMKHYLLSSGRAG